MENRPTDHLSWTSHLIRSFYRLGIRHVIISPGSRSTPLVLAAATHPGFRKQVVLDERSAAFQALGIGKATGKPALLICTSGTALANYHPAVIEARESGVPVIILSADRPPHLRGSGSSQTIDQIKIFGDSAVMFHELGEPVHEKRDYGRLRLLAEQAVTASINSGGAAHLNAPFRKPLEPSDESMEKSIAANQQQIQDPTNRQDPDPDAFSSVQIQDHLVNLINRAEKPILLAGADEQKRALSSLADHFSNKLNIPVLAEPGSHLSGSINFLIKFDILLQNNDLRNSLKPDLIIRTGGQPYSKSLQIFESSLRDLPVIQILTRDTWQDSFSSVNHRIVLHNSELLTDPIKPKKKEWKERWAGLDARAAKLVDDALNQADALTDGHVMHHFSHILSNDWNQMISNSFTVRDFALFGRPADGYRDVFVNRGAAGIDGILSTALGIALGSGKKTAVFAGDLAFLHDSNALLSLQNTDLPVVIIVINNNGGNIFRMLPVYRYRKYYETYFEAPQQTGLSHLARASGIDYVSIENLDQLYSISEEDLTDARAVVVECKTDPDRSMSLRQQLWASGSGLIS